MKIKPKNNMQPNTYDELHTRKGFFQAFFLTVIQNENHSPEQKKLVTKILGTRNIVITLTNSLINADNELFSNKAMYYYFRNEKEQPISSNCFFLIFNVLCTFGCSKGNQYKI